MAGHSIVWRAAEMLFALEVGSIVEIVPPVAARPVAGVPYWVLGVFDHRGATVPLVDVGRLLAADGRSAAPEEALPRLGQRIVVAAMPAPHADRRVGLRVDALLDLVVLKASSEASHPGFETPLGAFLGPLVETPWGVAQKVSPRELFDEAQWAVLAGRLAGGEDGGGS